MSILAFAAAPLFACPQPEKTVKQYIEDNFPADEGQPSPVEHRLSRLTANVATVELTVRGDGENKDNPPQIFTLFFAGSQECRFVFQADGEITETIDAGTTKYVFIKTEDNTADEQHANFQVITVRATGEITTTHDQHGQEIYFSQSVQPRCAGKVGEVTHFIHDKADKSRVTLRQQHTDRDGKCRIIEDTSTFKYYRLTTERWELDEGAADNTVVEKRR